jgi:hypothetical protein
MGWTHNDSGSRRFVIVTAIAIVAFSWWRRRLGAQGARVPAPRHRRPTTITPASRIFDRTFNNWNGERDVWSIVDGLRADTTRRWTAHIPTPDRAR